MKTFKDFGVNFQQTTLKNNTPLFLFERKGMPINIRTVFYAGSRFDNIPGTAHFLEHMLVAGTKKFPSKNLLAEHIQKIGGDFGAVTNQDTLKIWLEIPESDDLDVGIEILSECLTQSLFDEKTIENERGAILSELKAKKTNPNAYISDLSRKIAFQGTSIENGNLGTEMDVKSIRKEDLLDYYRKFINTGRVVFVVSGDVSIKELESKFNLINLQSGERFTPKDNIPIYDDEKIIIENYPNVNQLQVNLTSRISIDNYKDLCSLYLINSILANGRGSRLITKLRYQNGLVYSLGGSIMSGQDWGRINIGFSCDKENYNKAKSMVFDEFDNLKQNNISDDELKNIKSRILKGIVRGMQTSGDWTSFHDNDFLYEGTNAKTLEDYLKTVENLTLEDIKTVIDKYFIKEKFLMAICGDIKESEASN